MFRFHTEKFCFFIQYPNPEAYFFVAVSEFTLFFVLNVTKKMHGSVKPFSFSGVRSSRNSLWIPPCMNSLVQLYSVAQANSCTAVSTTNFETIGRRKKKRVLHCHASF